LLGYTWAAPPEDLPLLTTLPLNVNFETSGWFGAGWYGPEGRAGNTFRWTAARDAIVNVLVYRSQALKIRMTGSLAIGRGARNTLAVLWNDELIRRPSPWESHEDEWIVPSRLVHRGQNTFTIRTGRLVSPAREGIGLDQRSLGAGITGLSFSPAPATAAPDG